MNLPPRFLNWRMIDGRKVPCRGDGTICDAHDPANHVTLEVATAAGLGVAFDIRAEDGLFFLDLDKCYENGEWSAEARAIFTSFGGAWGEVSQSGTGLHVIGRCDPAMLRDRRSKWDGWKEFYTDKRFVAFGPTGWAPIGGEARDIDWTEQLLRIVPQREDGGDLPEGVDPAYTGPEDDDELIAMMLRSTGGAAAAFGQRATVGDLWNANVEVLSRVYPDAERGEGYDASSADAALFSHLAFWTGKDMPRMDRLFRRSALMREKYEKRPDYRKATVEGCVRRCKTVYDRPRPTATLPAPERVAGDEMMLIADMREHFKGCVYIRDAHRVLVPDGARLKPEQFNATYGGYTFQMMPNLTKPTNKAFEALTENRAHRFPQAVRPCFRPDLPGGEILPNGDVNIYVDPGVPMTPGDATPFLGLLERLLPDRRDRDILLAYMAGLVQNIGTKFQWAPVLQGVEGNGKTALFSCVAYAVGRHYTYQPRPDKLGSNFNSYLEGKVFVLVEEVHMRGRREMLDILKPLVTNQEIEIEGKGSDARMIQNVTNWAFCTNYMDAVIKSDKDRRYAIFHTAQQHPSDLVRDGMSGSYFPDLYRWLRGPGYATVAHYLANYAIPEDLNPAGACHRAPQTSSTAAAIRATMGPAESEVVEAVESDLVGFRGGWVSAWHLDRLLREKGIRLSRNKQNEIMLDMGYERRGRYGRPLLQEGGVRPVLYSLPGVTSDYSEAQFYASL